jgi:conjugative transfer signal peptidase TraF
LGRLPTHRPLILWNTTASAPLGFFRLRPSADPAAGTWVVLRPPPGLGAWLVAGGYVPAHVPLLKRVAATAGQRICRFGTEVRIDGRTAAVALAHDRRGRTLPSWGGCRILGAGELLLLNAAPDSLDGRYFGPSRRADLLARAEPLWTWRAR